MRRKNSTSQATPQPPWKRIRWRSPKTWAAKMAQPGCGADRGRLALAAPFASAAEFLAYPLGAPKEPPPSPTATCPPRREQVCLGARVPGPHRGPDRVHASTLHPRAHTTRATQVPGHASPQRHPPPKTSQNSQTTLTKTSLSHASAGPNTSCFITRAARQPAPRRRSGLRPRRPAQTPVSETGLGAWGRE